MLDKLQEYGFTAPEDNDDDIVLEYTCPREYVDALAEALGITDSTEMLEITVYSDDTGIVVVDSDEYDVTIEDRDIRHECEVVCTVW